MADMMLGFLLARGGGSRGSSKRMPISCETSAATPSLDARGLMHELGILDAFLQRPHSETRQLDAQIGDARLTVADLSHLPTRCKFLIAAMV
jgi:hypothetical protein